MMIMCVQHELFHHVMSHEVLENRQRKSHEDMLKTHERHDDELQLIPLKDPGLT